MSLLNKPLFGAALVLLLTLSAGASAQDMPKVSLAIGSTSLVGSMGKLVGEMGLYRKHGLDAKVISVDNGAVANTALISKSVEFTTTSGSEIVVAQARGQEMVVINSVYSNFSGVLVLSKAVADKINLPPNATVQDKLKALDGLTIATPGATSSFTFALKPAAESVGAKPKFTYVAQGAMIAAFESGAIQGFIAGAPVYVPPVLKNTGVIWISGPKGEFPQEFLPAISNGVIALRSYAEANPEIIRRMREVYVDFANIARDRPEEVKAAIARMFPDMDRPTLDFLFETERASFKVKTPTAEDFVREIKFVKLSGLNLPNVDSINPAAMAFPEK